MKFTLSLVSIFVATSFSSSYAEGRSLRIGKDVTDEWWNNDHHQRSLQNQECPTPDTFTSNLSFVRTGQYSSTSGDCFYLYWDPAICHPTNKCPLYVYVDGTGNAQGKDNWDLIGRTEELTIFCSADSTVRKSFSNVHGRTCIYTHYIMM